MGATLGSRAATAVALIQGALIVFVNVAIALAFAAALSGFMTQLGAGALTSTWQCVLVFGGIQLALAQVRVQAGAGARARGA